MGKPKDVLISVVLDRSGSMHATEQEVRGGFNAFIADQKKEPGRCRLSLIQFDTVYQVDLVAEPIGKVKDLDEHTYQPRGLTALNDAVVRSINETKAWVKQSGWKGKVLTLIITDGYENASREYPGGEGQHFVKNLITKQRKKGWDFVFLGADIEAGMVATELGIGQSASYASANTGATMSAVSGATSSYRQTGDVDDFDVVQKTSDR